MQFSVALSFPSWTQDALNGYIWEILGQWREQSRKEHL